jgi:hypothetical protein
MDDDGDVVLTPSWDNFDQYSKVPPARRMSQDRPPKTFKETKIWELYRKMRGGGGGEDAYATTRSHGTGSAMGMELQGKKRFSKKSQYSKNQFSRKSQCSKNPVQ